MWRDTSPCYTFGGLGWRGGAILFEVNVNVYALLMGIFIIINILFI